MDTSASFVFDHNIVDNNHSIMDNIPWIADNSQ